MGLMDAIAKSARDKQQRQESELGYQLNTIREWLKDKAGVDASEGLATRHPTLGPVVTIEGVRLATKRSMSGRPDVCLVSTCSQCGEDYAAQQLFGLYELASALTHPPQHVHAPSPPLSVCPLLSIATDSDGEYREAACLRERCAWWHNDQCGAVTQHVGVWRRRTACNTTAPLREDGEATE